MRDTFIRENLRWREDIAIVSIRATQELYRSKKKKKKRKDREPTTIHSEPAGFNSGDRPRGRHESDRRPGWYGRAIIRPVTVQGATRTQRDAFGMTERGPRRDAYPRVERYVQPANLCDLERRGSDAREFPPEDIVLFSRMLTIQGVSRHVRKNSGDNSLGSFLKKISLCEIIRNTPDIFEHICQ